MVWHKLCSSRNLQHRLTSLFRAVLQWCFHLEGKFWIAHSLLVLCICTFFFWLDLTWLGKFFALFSGQGVVLPFSPFVSPSVCLSVCVCRLILSFFLFVCFFLCQSVLSVICNLLFIFYVSLFICLCLKTFVCFFLSLFRLFIFHLTVALFSLCVSLNWFYTTVFVFFFFFIVSFLEVFFFIFKKISQNCQLLLPQINRLRSKIWFLGEKA